MQLIQRYFRIGIEKDWDGIDFIVFGEDKYLEVFLGWRECLEFAMGFNGMLREILQPAQENVKHHYERVQRELKRAEEDGRDTGELVKHLESVKRKMDRLTRIREELVKVNDVINDYLKGGEECG